MSAFVSKHLSFCVEEMLAEVDAALTEHALVKALAQLDERDAHGEALDAVCGQALRAKLEGEIKKLPLLRMRDKIIELQNLVAETGIDRTSEDPTNAAGAEPSPVGDSDAVTRHADGIDAFLDEFDLSDDSDVTIRNVIGAQRLHDDFGRALLERAEPEWVNPPEAIEHPVEPPRDAAAATASATADVVDLNAYRVQSRGAQAEQEVIAPVKPKLRVRVQARTSQALALTSMALVCWISVPPLSFGPAPLRAVEIAAEQVVGLLPFAARLMALGGVLLS